MNNFFARFCYLGKCGCENVKSYFVGLNCSGFTDQKTKKVLEFCSAPFLHVMPNLTSPSVGLKLHFKFESTEAMKCFFFSSGIFSHLLSYEVLVAFVGVFAYLGSSGHQ